MNSEQFGKMWHHKCRRDVVEFTTREECPVCGKRREKSDSR